MLQKEQHAQSGKVLVTLRDQGEVGVVGIQCCAQQAQGGGWGGLERQSRPEKKALECLT